MVSYGIVLRVFLENGSDYVFYGKLDELEKRLKKSNSQFVRIHKSYLVNGRQMERYSTKNVKLRNGMILPVSLNRRKNLLQYHMEYMERLL